VFVVCNYHVVAVAAHIEMVGSRKVGLVLVVLGNDLAVLGAL
jgi:hypothetical protein